MVAELANPRICDWCNGKGEIYAGGTHAEWGNCPNCFSNGYVYPRETVEQIAKIIYDSDVAASRAGDPIVKWNRVLREAPHSPWHRTAVAILDALNGKE